MGGEPWMFVTAHAGDPRWALARARQEVFESGQYRGAEQKPATPEAALEAMAECGTASILDITRISETPQICAASPVSDEELLECFGTTSPGRDQVDDAEELFEYIERGEARYVVLHGPSGPEAVLFMGYSFD